MNRTDGQARSAVVDNWLLQLACEILEFGLLDEGQEFRARRVGGYDTSVWNDFKAIESASSNWGWFTQDHVSALLQLLDVLILYDSVAHDTTRSYVWDDSPAFKDVTGILRPVAIPEELPTAFAEFIHEHKQVNASGDRESTQMFFHVLGKDAYRVAASDEDPFFEQPGQEGGNERALFYLAFSLHADATYWPAPPRATFLSDCVSLLPGAKDIGIEFQANLKRAIEGIARRFVRTSSDFVAMPELLLPGLGSVALSNCETPRSILPTVLEMRRSRPAITFRRWLADYQDAIASSNLLEAANQIRGVQEILSSVEEDFGLDDSKATKLELQIGVTPSVTLGERSIAAFFRKLFPKRRHLLFIRDYVQGALSAADLSQDVKRLFPDIPFQGGTR